MNGRGNATQQMFRDGIAVPEEHLERLAKIADEIRVLHKWEESDVLVHDNVGAQHGREPWRGEWVAEVVMASLFDGEVGKWIGEWTKVAQVLDDNLSVMLRLQRCLGEFTSVPEI